MSAGRDRGGANGLAIPALLQKEETMPKTTETAEPEVKPGNVIPASAVKAPAQDEVLEPVSNGVFYIVRGRKVDPNGFPLEPDAEDGEA